MKFFQKALCHLFLLTLFVVSLYVSNPAFAATYPNGTVSLLNKQDARVDVTQLTLNPGGFDSEGICNGGSSGVITLNNVPPKEDYRIDDYLRYIGSGRQCDLKVTRKDGPTKYQVSS